MLCVELNTVDPKYPMRAKETAVEAQLQLVNGPNQHVAHQQRLDSSF